MIATPTFLTLHGARCTVILEAAPGEAPLWRYFGPRLPDGASPGPGLRDTRPTPSFSLDFDQPLSIFPTFGVGWFGQSALLAHRGGRDFAQAFTHCAVDWLKPGRALSLTLTDAIAAIRVVVELSLDPASDVLTLSSALTNTGEGALDVQWLAAGVAPLPASCTTVRSYVGRHNHEFILEADALGRHAWRRENRRGLTSHDAFPGAVVAMPSTTEDGGLAYGAQLAWSGNHAQTIEWLDDGRFQWQMGEWLAPGEVRLGPGKTLNSPQMLLTCSERGLGGVAANFHGAIRSRMTWPGGAMRPRPVGINTWEGFYFDHRLDDLKALADSAAELGVERFVLDDGWFHRRADDTRGLGDWWPDVDKYPDGLAPLAAHVTGLGLEFGLWVEPEMVNPDSDLYRAHPDWALHIEGRPRLTARNQLVLDLAREGVADYLSDKIGALLRDLPIGYLKWDHNRDLTTAAGADGQAAYRRQTLAAYALFARLRAAFPDVEIEACAGGGGRIDAGLLRHTHRVWTSDCIDAVSRVAIQRGFLQFFPPEIMGAHVGAAPAHSTSRAQSMAFRAAVALPGHFGVELDARKIEGADRATLKAWIALYKSLRDRLHGACVWLGEAGDGVVWQAHGEADDLVLFVYRLEMTGRRFAPAIALAVLDPAAVYAVRRIDPHGADAGAAMSGAWLAASGLPVPPLKPEQCAIFRLVRQ